MCRPVDVIQKRAKMQTYSNDYNLKINFNINNLLSYYTRDDYMTFVYNIHSSRNTH